MQVLFLFTVLAAFAASAAAAPNREQRDLAARASPYKVTLLLGPGVKGMETTGAIQTGTWTLEAPSGGNDYIPLEFKIGAKEKRLSVSPSGTCRWPETPRLTYSVSSRASLPARLNSSSTTRRSRA
jgi:hypothetical protein